MDFVSTNFTEKNSAYYKILNTLIKVKMIYVLFIILLSTNLIFFFPTIFETIFFSVLFVKHRKQQLLLLSKISNCKNKRFIAPYLNLNKWKFLSLVNLQGCYRNINLFDKNHLSLTFNTEMGWKYGVAEWIKLQLLPLMTDAF